MADIKFTDAQRDAISARNASIAVSAAAGSGKTAVLTRRIIERVTAKDGTGELSRILVVTFTKAAAAELRSRISDALDDALAKDPQNKHIRTQSLLVPSAHISTIHSFCLDLIRTNFQRLGIPPDFSPGDETEISLMMREIAEELIADCFEGNAEFEFHNFDCLADTLGDMVNTDKLADTVLSLYKTLSSTEAFLDGIDNTADAMYKAASNGFDGSPWEQSIRSCLFDLLSHYERIYADALEYVCDNDAYIKYETVFSEELQFIQKVLSHINGGDTYASLAALLSTYEPSRLPTVKNADADVTMKFFKGQRTLFKDELRDFRGDYYGYSSDALRDALCDTATVLSDLSLLLQAFEERFSAEKLRRRVITFADMERLALRLLYDKEKDAPTELALSLCEMYDEVFIDEYQDTNELQDKIFRLISRPDNRFNVGDKKQSIYSFRGAVPSLFDRELQSRPKYEKGSSASAVKIFLSENFRSTAEILHFCNGIFETLMNTSTVSYGAEERLNCGSGKHGPLPQLCLIARDAEREGEEDDSDAEAAYVAEQIARYLSEPPRADGSRPRPSDVAILLRSTSASAAAYEEALRRRGIPCRNTDAEAFFESPEVLLMLSLLNVIDNPSRDIYLAAALKSPIFGVTLGELVYMKRRHPDGSLYEALCRFTEEEAFQKGAKFLEMREKYAMLAAETSCDRLIWQLYSETGIFSILCADKELAVYEIEEAKANLTMLYHYAKGFEKGGFKGLSGFLSFVGKVIANKEKLDVSQFAAPGEVVSIMTIHKSKGLEFPVCFVSGLARGFNASELREKTVYHDTLGVAVKLSSAGGFLRLDTPMRGAVLLEHHRRAAEEELRILYVALTRAKERLYLTASVSRKGIEGGRYDLGYGSEYALQGQYFSSYSVRRATGWFDLLLAAAAGIGERFTSAVVTSIAKGEAAPLEERAEETEDIPLYEAKRLVAERLDFEYPYRRLCRVPSKLSVSRLYPEVLDDSAEGVASREGVPERTVMPRFLMREDHSKPTAAERGTAMHTFMQFCDFRRVTENGIEAEIRRLSENKFIFPSDAGKLDRRKLSAFFESGLAREMMASDALVREKRFMLRFPASLFTKEEDAVLQDEELLVQGVIDCAYRNGAGELILVDYKTDHFSPSTPREEVEATLRERHSEQLTYYKLACQRLFGTLPSHTYLYAFALDDIVEIY